ncbi:hypothetical protein [Shewanella baltica]|uniref:hypothetical protein n=1 Tax=Shewanella baltica TaxID=62322 RepID=UPI00217D3C6A|nr:hypothetical protein [Shewanella baltica]MCS6100261.1 hypothetical protein [Shewanella baltica]MCS6182886.1 hypothetical protein [Shewanella baltica]
MLRVVLLFIFSAVVGASEPTQSLNENSIENFQKELHGLKTNLDNLSLKVEQTAINNDSSIKESQLVVEKLGSTIAAQHESQQELVSVLNEIKKINKSQTDLQFAIETDVPYVITVSMSIFASVFITWLLLRRDLNANHNRLIKEFRQKWVNDFRDTVSAYVDIASQIETFQKNNTSFYLSRHYLIELKNDFDESLREINAKGLLNHEKVKAKLAAQRDFEQHTLDEKTDYYQGKNTEYLKLISSAKILESKLLLLLKPDFRDEDRLDKNVFEAINELKGILHSPQGRHGIVDYVALEHYSEKLLTATQYLLKTEWDRIKELDKKSWLDILKRN